MTPFAELQSFVVKHTDSKYFEADLKLYKKCFPGSRLIQELDRAPEFAKKNLDERMVTEILNDPAMCIDTVWEYRGFARDEKGKLIPIGDNGADELTDEQIKEIAQKATFLIESIAGSSNMEGVAKIKDNVFELIKPLPEGAQNPIIYKVKETVETAKSHFEALEKLERIERTEKALLSTDLKKAGYNDRKRLVFDLYLDDKCENHKSETYLKVLEEKKVELLKKIENGKLEASGSTEGTDGEANGNGDGSVSSETDEHSEGNQEKLPEASEEIPGEPGEIKSDTPAPGEQIPPTEGNDPLPPAAEASKKKEGQESSTQE